MVLHAETIDRGGDGGAVFAVSDDFDPGVESSITQDAKRLDEEGESLLLDESTDAENRRGIARPVARSDAFERKSVVNDFDFIRRAFEKFLFDPTAVRFADGDDERRRVESRSEQLAIDGVAIDVLRVRGYGEGRTSEVAARGGDVRGHRGEMRVQMVEAFFARRASHQQRVDEDRGALVGRQKSDVRHGAFEGSGGEFRGFVESRHRGRAAERGEVANRGLHLRQIGVESALVGGRERSDVHFVAQTFHPEDFVQDERLAQTGVFLEDVADLQWSFARHGCNLNSWTPEVYTDVPGRPRALFVDGPVPFGA